MLIFKNSNSCPRLADMFSAREASWRRAFDPCVSLLFILYHYLENQNRPRSYQPGPSWLPGSTPSIFQEAFRAELLMIILIERKPPPPGGFPIYYVPSSRTVCQRTPPEEPCVRGPLPKILVQILLGGSSYTRFLMREHSK